MPIITKQEAAALLRVSIRALEGLISNKQLPVTRIGRTVRINRADVLALVPAGGRQSKDDE